MIPVVAESGAAHEIEAIANDPAIATDAIVACTVEISNFISVRKLNQLKNNVDATAFWYLGSIKR